MKNIAVLITCFNRKEKTLKCLDSLYKSVRAANFTVFLTDDASTDGTAEAVKELYPNVKVFQGNGNLFWAGGMRNSWEEATKENFDGYLLLNDDSVLFEKTLEYIINADNYSINKYNKHGVYIGSTIDYHTNQLTYGGSIVNNKWSYKHTFVVPDNKNYVECDLGNANILYVSKDVIESIDFFPVQYIHGKADYDLTLRAKSKGWPVFVIKEYCGYCERDHQTLSVSQKRNMTLKQRIDYLYSPKGVELKAYIYFMKSHYPYRVPFVWISLWAKTLIPSFTNFIDTIKRNKPLL